MKVWWSVAGGVVFLYSTDLFFFLNNFLPRGNGWIRVGRGARRGPYVENEDLTLAPTFPFFHVIVAP